MPFLNSNEELRELNRRELYIIWLITLASFFTCFNFVVYVAFNDVIIDAFFAKDLDKNLKHLGFLALLLVGYVSRPLGGIVLSDIADRFGRKRVLLYSLVTMVLSTFLIAILPTYEHIGVWAILLLIVARFIQGVGIGSEFPISWVYMVEQIPRFRIGLASSLLIISAILPIFFANMLSGILLNMFNIEQMTQFGWRIPFLIGAIGSLLTIMLRYRLTETPLWLMAKNNGQLLTKFPIRRAFQKYRYGLSVTFFLSFFTASIYLFTFLLLPDIAITYFDVDSRQISIGNSVAVLFGCLGALLFGYCADKFNVGRVFGIGCLLLAISSLLFFYQMANDSDFLLLYYVIFGFFSGIIGVVPSVCVRLFHIKVRCTGISLSYNIAYGLVGAYAPLLMTYAMTKLLLAPALYLVFLCVCGMMLSILLTHLHGLYRVEKLS